MLLDDAKRARVMVVCQWFTETVAGGATVYVLGGVIHPIQYSAWSILGEAHLDLVDSATQTYRFVDEGGRSMFELACEVTEPREAVSPTPQRTQAPESKAETTARRKAEEESRKAEAVFEAPESRWWCAHQEKGARPRQRQRGIRKRNLPAASFWLPSSSFPSFLYLSSLWCPLVS